MGPSVKTGVPVRTKNRLKMPRKTRMRTSGFMDSAIFFAGILLAAMRAPAST